MSNLTKIVEESVGKDSFSMRLFFQKMIESGELKAFSVDVDKKTVEKNNEDELVTRTKKGATLTETTELTDYQPYFIEDPKTGVKYYFNVGARGGVFFNDGDGQDIYHNCLLMRVDQALDYRKITGGHNTISIPTDKITGTLRVSFTQTGDYSGSYDRIENTGGHLEIEGEQDSLFEKVYEFVTGRKITDPTPVQKEVPF